MEYQLNMNDGLDRNLLMNFANRDALESHERNQLLVNPFDSNVDNDDETDVISVISPLQTQDNAMQQVAKELLQSTEDRESPYHEEMMVNLITGLEVKQDNSPYSPERLTEGSGESASNSPSKHDKILVTIKNNATRQLLQAHSSASPELKHSARMLVYDQVKKGKRIGLEEPVLFTPVKALNFSDGQDIDSFSRRLPASIAKSVSSTPDPKSLQKRLAQMQLENSSNEPVDAFEPQESPIYFTDETMSQCHQAHSSEPQSRFNVLASNNDSPDLCQRSTVIDGAENDEIDQNTAANYKSPVRYNPNRLLGLKVSGINFPSLPANYMQKRQPTIGNAGTEPDHSEINENCVPSNPLSFESKPRTSHLKSESDESHHDLANHAQTNVESNQDPFYQTDVQRSTSNVVKSKQMLHNEPHLQPTSNPNPPATTLKSNANNSAFQTVGTHATKQNQHQYTVKSRNLVVPNIGKKTQVIGANTNLPRAFKKPKTVRNQDVAKPGTFQTTSGNSQASAQQHLKQRLTHKMVNAVKETSSFPRISPPHRDIELRDELIPRAFALEFQDDSLAPGAQELSEYYDVMAGTLEGTLTVSNIQDMENVREHLHSMLRLSNQALKGADHFDHSDAVGDLLTVNEDSTIASSNNAQKHHPGSPDIASTAQVEAWLSNNPSHKLTEYLDGSRAIEHHHGLGAQSLADPTLIAELKVLREKVEKERYRRMHCEELIQELNTKMLECQQQLAVAVSTDRKKDTMIEQLDKQLAKVVEGWKKREGDREEYIEQLKKEKASLTEAIHQQQQMLCNFEEDITRVMTELKQQKDDGQITIDTLHIQVESREQELQDTRELLDAERERTRVLQMEYDRMMEWRVESDHKMDELRSNLEKEQEDRCNKEKSLLLMMNQMRADNERTVHEHKDAMQDVMEEKEDLSRQIKLSQTDIKRFELELDSQRRGKESLKIEMGLMDAKHESSQRRQEADIRADMEKHLAEKLTEAHKRAEKRQEDLQEHHRKQMAEFGERQQRELECQLDEFHQELKRKDDQHRLRVQEYEDRLSQYRTDVASLEISKQKLEAQRSEMLGKLQNLMQSQWNEAVSLLGCASPAKQNMSIPFGFETSIAGVQRPISPLSHSRLLPALNLSLPSVIPSPFVAITSNSPLRDADIARNMLQRSHSREMPSDQISQQQQQQQPQQQMSNGFEQQSLPYNLASYQNYLACINSNSVSNPLQSSYVSTVHSSHNNPDFTKLCSVDGQQGLIETYQDQTKSSSRQGHEGLQIANSGNLTMSDVPFKRSATYNLTKVQHNTDSIQSTMFSHNASQDPTHSHNASQHHMHSHNASCHHPIVSSNLSNQQNVGIGIDYHPPRQTDPASNHQFQNIPNADHANAHSGSQEEDISTLHRRTAQMADVSFTSQYSGFSGVSNEPGELSRAVLIRPPQQKSQGNTTFTLEEPYVPSMTLQKHSLKSSLPYSQPSNSDSSCTPATKSEIRKLADLTSVFGNHHDDNEEDYGMFSPMPDFSDDDESTVADFQSEMGDISMMSRQPVPIRPLSFSPPVKQPRQHQRAALVVPSELQPSKKDTVNESSVLNESAMLNVEYSELSDKLQQHEVRQSELQHYIKMLLNRSPGDIVSDTSGPDSEQHVQASADPTIHKEDVAQEVDLSPVHRQTDVAGRVLKDEQLVDIVRLLQTYGTGSPHMSGTDTLSPQSSSRHTSPQAKEILHIIKSIQASREIESNATSSTSPQSKLTGKSVTFQDPKKKLDKNKRSKSAIQTVMSIPPSQAKQQNIHVVQHKKPDIIKKTMVTVPSKPTPAPVKGGPPIWK